MNRHCWTEVVIPLLSLRETATFGITTVAPAPDNFVTDLLNRKVIPELAIELVCDDCKRAGVVDQCRHREYLRPVTQDDERSAFVRRLYPEDDGDVYAREMQGVLKQPQTNCFNHDRIVEVYNGSRFDIMEKSHPYLFITIDPCGASGATTVSDFAIMSHVLPSLSIVGMEAVEVHQPLSWRKQLLEHMEKCLEIPTLRNAKIVVFVEGNMSTEAHNVKEIVRQVYPAAMFPGDLGPDKVGVLTTNRTKHNMQYHFALALLDRAVRISNRFVTTSDKPQALLEKWRNQLMQYSKVAKEGRTPLQGTRYVYSGKATSMHKKDDLAIVTQLGHLCAKRFLDSPEWIHYH